MLASVQKYSPMDRKKAGNFTEPDWLGLDRQLQLYTCQMERKIGNEPIVTD